MFTEKQKKIINHAYNSVPFYMDMCRNQEIQCEQFSSWEEIPVIEKNDVAMKNDSFLSAEYLAPYLQKSLMQIHTSGSTGKCVNVLWDTGDCKRSLLPLWLKRKKYYGINPHDKHCYFFTGRAVGKTDYEMEKQEFAIGFCKSDLNDEKLVEIWKRMREYEPIWMNLQPSMAVLLGITIQKYGLEPIPSLRYVETTGEMLFPQMRKFIEDTLHVKVADQYGCNELNSLAFECPNGQLHCMEENAVVEIVDKKGNRVPDGEEGEICATTLTNLAMPLIRYKVGDRGRIVPGKCSCGEKGRILELTTGRSNDWVIDREGNLLNAYIFARCVENVNKIEEHAILQFQVVQHDIDDFTIHLVLDEDCEPDIICEHFMDNLWQSSLMDANFKILLHEELLPEEKTGKLRWFISEMEL